MTTAALTACGGPHGGSGAAQNLQPTIAATYTPPAVASATARTSNAPSGEQSFLAQDSTDVVFVRWTDNAGTIRGSLDEVQADASATTGTQAQEVSFTGVRHGDDVTLTLSQGLGTYSSLTGRLSGGDLHLALPQANGQLDDLTLPAGSASGYNDAVAELVSQAHAAAQAQASASAQAASDAQAAAARDALDRAVVDADNTFAQDLVGVREAAAALAGEDFAFRDSLGEASTALAQTRKDLTTTQRDAHASPPDCGQVSSDAGAVSSDEGSVESAQGSVESATTSVESESQQLSDTLREAADDFAKLQQAAAADPAGATPTHHPPDLAAARNRDGPLLKKASRAVASALSIADADVRAAKGLSSEADTLDNRCTS